MQIRSLTANITLWHILSSFFDKQGKYVSEYLN